METFKSVRGALVAAACAVVVLGVFAASAVAVGTGMKICVPSKEGAAIVTAKAGACETGYTKSTLLPEAEQEKLEQVLPYEKFVKEGVDKKPTIQVSGANVQIVSGAAKETESNGLGNLVIGLDEEPGTQTGSDNLVMGTKAQSFTSIGALLAGVRNSTSGEFASVTGGRSNKATGPRTTVTGGESNLAEGETTSISGGLKNKTTGAESSVAGGEYNLASDSWSSVLGGCDNIAGAGVVPTGPCSNQAEAVLGGASNDATGLLSTISGGQSNHTEGDEATVAGGLGNYSDATGTAVGGGYSNFADAQQSSIAGGGENTTTGQVSTILGGYYNTATSDEATVVGGCSNIAGEGNISIDPSCYDFGGSFMSILGGIGNEDTTLGSVIAGGTSGKITGGETNSILGGDSESMSSSTGFLSRIGNTTFNP